MHPSIASAFHLLTAGPFGVFGSRMNCAATTIPWMASRTSTERCTSTCTWTWKACHPMLHRGRALFNTPSRWRHWRHLRSKPVRHQAAVPHHRQPFARSMLSVRWAMGAPQEPTLEHIFTSLMTASEPRPSRRLLPLQSSTSSRYATECSSGAVGSPCGGTTRTASTNTAASGVAPRLERPGSVSGVSETSSNSASFVNRSRHPHRHPHPRYLRIRLLRECLRACQRHHFHLHRRHRCHH